MNIALIERRLTDLSQEWVGENHLPSVIRKLNSAFRRSILYFSSNRYEAEYYKDHSIIVSGQYCPRIRNYVSENIIISLSAPKDQKRVLISKKGAKILLMKIFRTIVHEYRHREQHRKQGFVQTKKYTPPKGITNRLKLAYYGMPDEIDAHAYETRVEAGFGLLDINRLRVAHKIGWRESEAIFMYRKYFRELDPKIWKKFLKKVYKTNRGV